jgi:hypothetical protein
MSLFSEESQLDKDKQVKATGNRNKMPETPDLTKWGAEVRKGSPFLLDSFSPGSDANTTKP